MYPIIIIIVSILVQLAAAILAFRLIRVTQRITAWTFIAAASLLMALRRCLTLYGWLSQDNPVYSADIASDITSLGISALMLIGVALITPLFKGIERDKKQLWQSQQEFQLLVNNIPAIVFTGYQDGTVRFYDNKVMEITGYAREIFDSHRTKWADIVVPKDWQKTKGIIVQALKTDRAYVREYRIQHKNGELIWLQERSRIICDAQGQIDHISGVFFDITGKKQVEAALHDTMAKLQNTVNEVEQSNLYISLLNELAELLQACLTPQEAYKSIIHVAPKLFPDLAGSLYIVNPRKSILLEAVASWGGMDMDGEIFTLDECWAIRRGGVHIGKPNSDGLICKHISSELTKDYLCVPLIAQGEILGMFHLQANDHKLSNPIEFNQPAAVTVAKQISMSLANLNLRESLHIQAIIDPLTGLFNRRYMEETLDREIHRGKRREASIGVIMVDIDHFKRVNDNFGHEAGDMVLAAMAGLLKKHIRHEDIPCRYGGEEFLLILPEADLETTFHRAEELRLIISQLEVRHHGLALGTLTASFGVSICPEHGENVADIINAADSAMYLAKTKGRNQVAIAQDIHETEITHEGVITPQTWAKH